MNINSHVRKHACIAYARAPCVFYFYVFAARSTLDLSKALIHNHKNREMSPSKCHKTITKKHMFESIESKEMSTVYISNVDREAIRARIALKFGSLIEGVLHRRSHSIPIIIEMLFCL